MKPSGNTKLKSVFYLKYLQERLLEAPYWKIGMDEWNDLTYNKHFLCRFYMGNMHDVPLTAWRPQGLYCIHTAGFIKPKGQQTAKHDDGIDFHRDGIFTVSYPAR